MSKTIRFKFENEDDIQIREIVERVYEALEEKGYNPINQMVGYLITGDPTYITSQSDARNLIRSVERDEILEELLKFFIANK